MKILRHPESGLTRAVLGTKTKGFSAPRSAIPSLKNAPDRTFTKIPDLVNNLPLDSSLLMELTYHSMQVIEVAEKGVILKKTESACAGTHWQRCSPGSHDSAVPINYIFVSEEKLKKQASPLVHPAKAHKRDVPPNT